MATRLPCLMLIATLALGACASSELDPVAAETLGAEHLKTEIPEGWVQIRSTNTGALNLAEYVPPDTQDEWREKLTVEAMSGAGLPDPLQFIGGWAADQKPLCDELSNSPIFSGEENGYQTVVALMECRNNTRTGRPIITMVKAIKGNASLYTITRIWRLPDADSDLEKDAIARWSQALRLTRVCDPTLPEHACPDVPE